jgi:hypothetical protein
MFRSGLKRAFDRALVVLLCLAMPTPAVDASALAAQRQGGDRAQARDRVGVCHRTGSARWPFVFLELPAASVEAHRGHGDVVGVESWRDCPGGPATATPTTAAPDRDEEPDRDQDGDRVGHGDRDRDEDRHRDGDRVADGHGNRDRIADRHCDGDRDRTAERDAWRDRHRHGHRNGDADRDRHE